MFTQRGRIALTRPPLSHAVIAFYARNSFLAYDCKYTYFGISLEVG